MMMIRVADGTYNKHNTTNGEKKNKPMNTNNGQSASATSRLERWLGITVITTGIAFTTTFQPYLNQPTNSPSLSNIVRV
jgi:hypothetical protein